MGQRQRTTAVVAADACPLCARHRVQVFCNHAHLPAELRLRVSNHLEHVLLVKRLDFDWRKVGPRRLGPRRLGTPRRLSTLR